MNPLKGRCDACANFNGIGYCRSLDSDVSGWWTGCLRWEPKPKTEMSEEFKIIKGVIDVTKIRKERLFTKEGKSGKYLRVVLIKKKERDKYGQVCFMVKEDITKEEREAGQEGNFIGDMSAMKPKTGAAPSRPAATPEAEGDDDIPF